MGLTRLRDPAAGVLPLQEVFVADGAHAIGAWVSIETTASGAQQRHLGLICLLSHVSPEEPKIDRTLVQSVS